MMELYDAYQRSQAPTTSSNRWTRIMEAIRGKPSLNLRSTCCRLLRSKRNRRSLLLPALHVLTPSAEASQVDREHNPSGTGHSTSKELNSTPLHRNRRSIHKSNSSVKRWQLKQ
jgi:hypothetical protein